MKASIILVFALTIATIAFGPKASFAASKHNGTCMGFAGSSSGYPFAGLKCYLDSAPGDWVIRTSVTKRDDPDTYKKLLQLPKRGIRCTLTKGRTSRFNGMESTNYRISNC